MAKFRFNLIIILHTMISSCLGQSGTDSRKEFESNVVKVLNLKLVVRDTDFEYSRLHMFKDTLFGAYKRSVPRTTTFSTAANEYFIQNLAETSKLTEFVNYDLSYYSSPSFDCYRNGCVYMSYGSGMQTLCSDGKITEYFSIKQDNLNYAYKVILYKNEAILIRLKDIITFNINSQKKIWKFEFPKKGITYSLLKGDSLFFSTWIDRIATVVCYDMKKHSVLWKKRIEEREPNFAPADYDPSYCLFRDNNKLIVPTWYSCYSLDMNTGNTDGKVPWNSDSGENILFKAENNRLYLDDFSNGLKTTKCIDLNNNRIIWELKDTNFLGIYKDYVVANNADWSYYLIIDKLTGLIKYKFPSPISKRKEFDFIGDYILINRNAIYK